MSRVRWKRSKKNPFNNQAAGAGTASGNSFEKAAADLGAQPLAGRAESGFSKAARRALLSPEIIRISGRIKPSPSHEGTGSLDLRRLLSDFREAGPAPAAVRLFEKTGLPVTFLSADTCRSIS